MEDQLLKLIEKAANRAAVKGIVIGTASEITESTCTVTRFQAPTLYGVRLHAVDDVLNSSVTVIPKDGSYVLVGIIEGLKTEAVVLKCSEIEKVLVKIGDVQYECTSDGHAIKKGDESLKKILEDLLAAIKALTVPTNTGPSGTPINATSFDQLKTRVNELLQ